MSDTLPFTRPVGASFSLPGQRIDIGPVRKFTLPESGLRLHVPCRQGRFYDVVGHRCALLGEECGPFEVWGHPFKYVAHGEVAFRRGERILKPVDLESEITVTPEVTVFTYSGEGIRIRHIIFVPLEQSGTVHLFDIIEGAPLTINLSFRTDLKLMWPSDWQERGQEYGFDEATGAWVMIGAYEEHTVFIGSPTGRACTQADVTPGLRTISIDVSANDAASTFPAFVIAGSLEGVVAAREEYVRTAGAIPALLAQNAEYYHALLDDTLTIETPDQALNDAYRWAKIGLDKCFVDTPSVGAGYVAGWNGSGDGGRPGFGWYFGRDSSWESFAACDYGQFEKVRRNLDLLGKYQVPSGDNRGKIYHELSAAHDFCFDKAYAYVAGDSTPFYIIDMAAYLRWTGDLAYIRKQWSGVRSAVDWCYRMDVDGDLLIDNPPAGHQWYDHGEKNMVDLVAIWAHALERAAWMGRLLNDSDAERWAADASKVRLILNSDFWDNRRGYVYDRKLRGETFGELTTANPSISLLWGLILPEKAQRSVNVLFGEGMDVPWGTRTNSSADDIYDPWGYHEGTVWPLVTGWASLAAYRNHRPVEGFKNLKANADLTNAFTPGYITEVLGGEECLPGGCPHQGWSEAMVIMPLVEGMLGLDANVVDGTIRFAPHLPADWGGVRIANLRAGGTTFDLEFRQEADRVSLSVRRTSGRGQFKLEFSPAFPRGAKVLSVTVNGQEIDEGAWDIWPTPTDQHVELLAEIGEAVELELRF